MALQKQAKTLIFSQGLDTRTNPDLLPVGKLHALENARFRQVGRISKKNGSTAFTTSIGSTKYTPIAPNLPAAKSAFNFQSSLLSVVPGARTADALWANSPDLLYTYSPTQQRWDYAARASSIFASSSTIGIQGLKTATAPYMLSGAGSFDTLFLNNYIFYVTSYTSTSFIDVLDSKTGEIVLSQDAPFTWCKIVAVGTKVYVIGLNGSNILGYAFDTSALGLVSSTITFATTAKTTPCPWDAIVSSSNSNLYIAFANNTSGITINRYSSLPTLGTATVANTLVDNTEAPARAFSLFGGESVHQQIYLAYNKTGTGIRLRIASMALTSVSLTTILAREATAITGSNFLYDTTNNRGIIIAETPNDGTSFDQCLEMFYWDATTATVLTYRSARQYYVCLASKLVRVNGMVYVMMVTPSANVGRTYYLLHIPLDNNATVGQPRPVAKLASGQAWPQHSFYDATSCMLPQVSAATNGTYLYTCGARYANQLDSSGNGYYLAQLFNYDFNDPQAYTSTEVGNLRYFVGGIPFIYDGGDYFEANFLMAPEVNKFPVLGASGSLTPSGTYQVCTVCEYTDGQGQRHQSAPSIPTTVVLGPSNNSFQIAAFPVNFSSHNSVNVAIYRTTAGGTLFYKESSSYAQSGGKGITVSCTLSDATLQTQELLYTTGNVIENQCPTGTRQIAVWGNRVWCLTDDGILYSKIISDGVPAGFNELQYIDLTGTPGTPVAIAKLGNKLLIFFQNSIHYISGDGPDDTGTVGSFSSPEEFVSGIGCIRAGEVVEVGQEVFFHSRDGWRAIDAALNIRHIGAELDNWFTEDTRVTSAAYIDALHEVRISDGTQTFVYDTVSKQWIVNTAWNDLRGVYWTQTNGARTYVRVTSAGVVAYEDSSSFSDLGTTAAMRLVTGWINMDQFLGFQRLYEIFLLGRYVSDCTLYVNVFYDYVPKIAETLQADIFPANVAAYSDANIYRNSSYSGIALPALFRLRPARQKCTAVRFEIVESTPSGFACELTGMSFVMGFKNAAYKASGMT